MARSIIKNNAPYVYLEEIGTGQYKLSVVVHLDGFAISSVNTSGLPATLSIELIASPGNVQTEKRIEFISNPAGTGELTVNVLGNTGNVLARTIMDYVGVDISTGPTSPADYMIPYLFLEKDASAGLIAPYVTIEVKDFQYATDTAIPPSSSNPNCEIYVAGLPSSGGPTFVSAPLNANRFEYPEPTAEGSFCEVTTVEYDNQTQIDNEFPPTSNSTGSSGPRRKKRKAKIKNINA